jgi:hypothetical protein
MRDQGRALVKRFVIMGGAYSDRAMSRRRVQHLARCGGGADLFAFGGVGAAPVVTVGLDVTRKTIIDGRVAASACASPANRMGPS